MIKKKIKPIKNRKKGIGIKIKKCEYLTELKYYK